MDELCRPIVDDLVTQVLATISPEGPFETPSKSKGTAGKDDLPPCVEPTGGLHVANVLPSGPNEGAIKRPLMGDISTKDEWDDTSIPQDPSNHEGRGESISNTLQTLDTYNNSLTRSQVQFTNE